MTSRENFFIGREGELEKLKSIWYSSSFEFVILRGRRGLGKTRLLKTWISRNNIPCLYIVASFSNPDILVKTIREQIVSQLGEDPRFRDLEDFIDFVTSKLLESKIAIVIDEFQKLFTIYEFMSRFLEEIKKLRSSNSVPPSVLVVSGDFDSIVSSRYSLLYREMLRYASAEIELKPLSFREVYRFLGDSRDLVEAFMIYAVFGGIPYYLSLVNPKKNLLENIEELVLSSRAPLKNEPLYLLSQKLRDIDRYSQILCAIAQGHHTLQEIARESRVPLNALPKYISTLEELGVIKRVAPLARRYTFYTIVDYYVNFWFCAVAPRLYYLELEEYSKIIDFIKSNISNYVERIWKRESLKHQESIVEKRGEIVEYAGPVKDKELRSYIDGVVRTRRKIYLVTALWRDLTIDHVFSIAEKAKRVFSGRERKNRVVVPAVYSRTVIGLDKGKNIEGIEVHVLRDLVE